jgi:alpha-beta hydrolase superfamily lysophospholipase
VTWGFNAAQSVAVVFCRLFLVLILLASSGCAWLDARQRQIIYRPTVLQPSDTASLRRGDERYFVSLPDAGVPQQIALWWLPHPDTQAPTLLYLHGTFRNLYGNAHKIEALRTAGFSVLAVDYRGWGESSPITPSEQSIMQDAQVAWNELTRRQPNPAKRVIYGHSMGSGVAVDLASRLQYPADYQGLVLESAFTSFADVAREAGWLTRVLKLLNQEHFSSIDKITQVKAPLLMLHGQRDDTIPIQLGERLFAAANSPKRWLAMEGAAHSDLNLVNSGLYQSTLKDYAATYLSGQ